MSKVEEFLMKYNPEGVDNIPLWELTAWDKKFNAVDKSMQKKVIKYKYYLAKDLDALVDDTGDIRILYTNEKVAYTSEEKCKGNICEGEIVAIPWGGTPTVKYYNGKFVTGDNRIATSLDTKILNNKYLFYWMISQLGTIADFYRGAGIQHPSMISVLSMQIPLPHIKVQEEIVKILDSFTNLIDALNEELSLRQKQFEYYREKLLTFDDKSINVNITPLGEIGNVCMCKRIMRNETNNEGGIPFYKIGTFGGIADSYISKDKFEEYKNKYNYPKLGDILISASGTIGKTVVFDGKPSYYQDSNIVWIDNDETKVINSFLRYIYTVIDWKVDDGGVIKRLYNTNIRSTLITYPKEKAVQQSIVEKLDAFESLISSLKEEIAQRQKQYEYYREKLLTFD